MSALATYREYHLMSKRNSLGCQFRVEGVPLRGTPAKVGLSPPNILIVTCRKNAVVIRVDGVEQTLHAGQRGLQGLMDPDDPTDFWVCKRATAAGVTLTRDGVLGIRLTEGDLFGGGEIAAADERALCISAFASDLSERIHEDDEGLLNGSIATIQVVAVTLEIGEHGVPYKRLWLAYDYVDLFSVREGECFKIFKPDPVHRGQLTTLRVQVDEISSDSLRSGASYTVTLSVDEGKNEFFVELAGNARRKLEAIASKHRRGSNREGPGSNRFFKPGVCEDCRFPRRPMDAA